jgi:hypothetical protein
MEKIGWRDRAFAKQAKSFGVDIEVKFFLNDKFLLSGHFFLSKQ